MSGVSNILYVIIGFGVAVVTEFNNALLFGLAIIAILVYCAYCVFTKKSLVIGYVLGLVLMAVCSFDKSSVTGGAEHIVDSAEVMAAREALRAASEAAMNQSIKYMENVKLLTHKWSDIDQKIYQRRNMLKTNPVLIDLKQKRNAAYKDLMGPSWRRQLRKFIIYNLSVLEKKVYDAAPVIKGKPFFGRLFSDYKEDYALEYAAALATYADAVAVAFTAEAATVYANMFADQEAPTFRPTMPGNGQNSKNQNIKNQYIEYVVNDVTNSKYNQVYVNELKAKLALLNAIGINGHKSKEQKQKELNLIRHPETIKKFGRSLIGIANRPAANAEGRPGRKKHLELLTARVETHVAAAELAANKMQVDINDDYLYK